MKNLIILISWSSISILSFGLQRSITHHNFIPRRLTATIQSKTCLYDAQVPESLAEEGTWQAFLDEETTGLIYYFDTATGESLWEPPTPTFPLVRLPRKKQRLADNLRREYREARQEMMNNSESNNVGNDSSEGFFSSFTAVLDTEDIDEKKGQPKTINTQEEGDEDKLVEDKSSAGWFNFFSASGTETSTEDTDVIDPSTTSNIASVEDATDIENKKDWFGDIFGAETSAAEDIEEEKYENDGQQYDKKYALLDSLVPFANLQRQSQQEVEREKVAEKNEEKIINDSVDSALKIEMGSHVLPHPAKVRWGGEDAIFIKGRTFGVFDGVSGAEKLDGVPLYSRTLANEMKKMVGISGVTVQDITAYLATAASYADGAATGASTAIVASIGESGFLQALNVGDSCCLVVRDDKITAKTREISHYWECPYQLSEDSPDQPKDGTKLNVELIPGDVIIMGSDGVFDNLSDDLILNVIKSTSSRPTPIAKKICEVSRQLSLDKTSVTPYSKQAQRRGDADYREGLGGKVDDVSCVVVVCK